MARNFYALQEFVNARYPDLQGTVQGGIYPPPFHAVVAAQLAQVLQWSTIGLMFFGNGVWTTLGITAPEWYGWFTDNKMQSFIGVFFVNSLANSMTATGAFDVGT
jgi:hypothetical protein